MATAVVCEDDAGLRRTLSAICEQVGLHVVAEVDSGADAAELTRRFGVDVLLLDLNLGEGISGQTTLSSLQDISPYPTVVVFTAYASNPEELKRLGAYEVVEKPHLERLIAVLKPLADGSAPAREAPHAPGDERRRPKRSPTSLPALWRSPAGISSSDDLVHSLEATVPGDAILVVALRGLELIDAAIGPLLAADNRLAVARHLRETLRAQDVVHDVKDLDGFAVVLRGGEATAAAAVWTRLLALASATGMHGHLMGAHATITELGGNDALARAVAAVQAAPPDVRLLITA